MLTLSPAETNAVAVIFHFPVIAIGIVKGLCEKLGYLAPLNNVNGYV